MRPSSFAVFAATLLLPATRFVVADTYEDDVRPILERRCMYCHGEDETNGEVRLDTLAPEFVNNSAAAETWHEVLNVLSLGEMPPDDEPQLTEDERDTVIAWLTEEMERATEARLSTGGRTVMRRLNRIEYQNTMVELLGVDLNYTANLPPDELSEDGFKNNGASLRMSALQLEYYLKAARYGLSRAIVDGPKPVVFTHAAEESEQDKGQGNWSNRLDRTGIFVARMNEFPDEGEFRIRVRARAEMPPGGSFPRMQLRMGFRADTQTPSKIVGIVDVTDTETQEFEFLARIDEVPRQSRTQSKYPGMLVWITNVYSDGQPTPKPEVKVTKVKGGKKRKTTTWPVDPDFPSVVIEGFEFEAPVFETWPPQHHERLVSAAADVDERDAARQSLKTFITRAFRRPATADEVATTMQFYDKIRSSADSFEHALRETFAMVLVSPEFLYLAEPTANGSLDDFAIASRLSYFLWSAPPDERLLKLAQGGQLRDAAVRQSEIVRLLNDERVLNFVDQFTRQWLDLDGVDRVAVNPEYYPDFDNALKPLMLRETQEFFAEILTNNLSALTFLDSSFLMLNERLARHYGITGPRGAEFERVQVPDESPRGGLLAQASILLANSSGEDSHPVKRGVWIRERLLNDPPAPPPPNVPNLNTDDIDVASLPLKEQLVQHRENDVCARCHAGIDPWGIALEEFDAIGLTRTKIRRSSPRQTKRSRGKRRRVDTEFVYFPVDAKTKLPDGTTVTGIHDLKRALATSGREKFTKALVSKLLSYALGRRLEFTDAEEVDRITQEFAKREYRLRDLIDLIVASDYFIR